jgi:predicted  nucleic acid-binding Zn-ribbon protein
MFFYNLGIQKRNYQMSIKSYNRGTEAIRRSFDKKDEVRAGRMLDKMNADMHRLEAENANLKAELEKARSAYQRRNAEVGVLKEEVSALEASNKSEHSRYMDCVQALIDSRKGHQKLTAVMKLALTPDQYHQYRQAAAEVYPELFKQEEKNVGTEI